MMMNKRMIIVAGLLLSGFFLWSTWQQEHPVVSSTQAASSSDVPEISSSRFPKAGEVPSVEAVEKRSLIHVKTDVLEAWIDPKGGNINKVALLKYPTSVEKAASPEIILNEDNQYVAQSGLISKEGPDSATLGQAVYSVSPQEYDLAGDQDQIRVNLLWRNKQGIEVTKHIDFTKNSYVIQISYDVTNATAQPWVGRAFYQIKHPKPEKSGFFKLNTYSGAAISSPDKKYEKINYDDMAHANLNRTISGGWASVQQRYFLSAWVPFSQTSFDYYTRVNTDGSFTIGLLGESWTISPHQKGNLPSNRLYVGPKLLNELEALAPGTLKLTIDYGFLWPISGPIFWVMNQVYQVIGNWGLAIILITLIIKLIFYKLSAKSYRSMARMRELQPKLEALKNRYGDDKAQLGQATMDLYRTEKVNPVGGCLPILVQLPVFIALYYVLIEAVEFRQAPFLGWIQDLSTQDPYFILPILMGASMVLQQKLSPTPLDPMQAKMMLIMPVVLTVLFVSFPAGLVLYWLTNNCLSILQQLYITRSYEKQLARK